MENAQINQYQNEYEAGLEDSQPANAPTDYELAQQIDYDEWMKDFGDYLAGENGGQTLDLLAYIMNAIKSGNDEAYGVNQDQDIADGLLGQLVRRHVTDYLRKTKGAV